MQKLETILHLLREFNNAHAKEGFVLAALFGSYARGEATPFSDIDVAYTIDHEKFYKDNAFAKLARIEEFKKELESKLDTRVDLISKNNKSKILQENLKKEEIAL